MDARLLIGLFSTLIVIIGLSVWSGTQRKTTQKKNSLPVVAGLIMGTLVGGSSSIGTAQLAYHFGFSAWWFTLGAGIACLILALIYAIPLRRSGCTTLVGLIRKEYGDTAGIWASILSTVGTFINIISQLISATAVIAVVFPQIPLAVSVLSSAGLMVLYVIFGGTKGTGIIGIVKMLLLYISIILCAGIVLQKADGLSGFTQMVNNIENPEGIRFFSLFARDVGTDLGACLSLILGVLTTQTYAQGVLSGRTDKDAVGGALLSAFLIPPIGIGGILVGLYMRANAAMYPALTAKTALTTFITTHMPPLMAGIILGALFVAVLGTGAGLALGISTNINNDIVKRLRRRADALENTIVPTRVWIIAVLTAAALLCCSGLSDTILKFSFMSMGLRGAVIFLPLCCSLWLPGRIAPKYALASILTGPSMVLLFGLWDILPCDPLFMGMLASLSIMGLGFYNSKKKQ